MSELSAVDWDDAIIVDVVGKALEGEVEVSGGCLSSSVAVNNDAGAIAKSRGSRASATREGAVRQPAWRRGGPCAKV